MLALGTRLHHIAMHQTLIRPAPAAIAEPAQESLNPMTRFAFLASNLAVAGALSPEDFAEAARQGFKTIINNRPDGEEPGQLTAADEIELSRQAGVAYRFVPAAKHEVLDDHVLAPFADALREAKGPILLHCRSGLRSTIMWAALQVGARQPLAEVLAIAKDAGFDLDAVRDEIAERAPARHPAQDGQRAAA